MTEDAFRGIIPFQELPLSHDFVFGEIMRRPEICILFLEALLDTRIERVEYITKQQDLSDSFWSRGVRLDVYLRDERHTVYSIEMQTTGNRILLRRIRYYQSMIDRNNLAKAEDYENLPESFIVMICTFDLFGKGLAVYRRRSVLDDCGGLEYDDGSHVYILNSAYRTGNADQAVLEFLDCIRENETRPEAYGTPLMKAVCPAVAELRRDHGKEAEYMMWELKLADARKEGLQEGRQEEFKTMLRGLYSAGVSVAQMAQASDRTEQEIISTLRSLGLSVPS